MRIAGVNVGKVTDDRARRATASRPRVVTMRIDDKGLPIHRTRRCKIRPRIFLEGNFFVDVQPGLAVGADARRRRHDPDQPDAARRSSSTRSSPRCRPTRARTSRRCSTSSSTGARRRAAPRASTARSRTGSPPTATRAIVADALLGEHEHDLSRLHQRAPARPPRRSTATREQLKTLITDFNTTAGAFAARATASSRSAIAELPRTLRAGHARAGAR